MRANGAYCALVSGGFNFYTRTVKTCLGFDYEQSNRLEILNQVLTGNLLPPILGKSAKRVTLERIAKERNIELSEAIAVGDGANDIEMLQFAGMGVAFHAKPSVALAARARIDFGDLTSLLYLQGYKKSDFKFR